MSQALAEPTTLDRRTQILEAAVVCFAKRGFHQASMHDISAEAGISVGLIYRYFQNKEAVIAAMAGMFLALLTSRPAIESAQARAERRRQASSGSNGTV